MKEKDYPFFMILSLIYGIIFTISLYKNVSGSTFPVWIVLSIIIFWMYLKKIEINIKKDSWIYIAGMLLIGISTVCTTSWFFIFFNWIGELCLFALFLLHQFYDDKNWKFGGYLKRIIFFCIGMLENIPCMYTHTYRYCTQGCTGEEKKKRKSLFLGITVGIVIAVLVLLMVVPLLLSSDAVFSYMFGSLLKHMKINTIPGYMIFFFIGVNLCYMLFAMLCKRNIPEKDKEKKKSENIVIALTFTGILSMIYMVYCVIQILYLFIGIKRGLPMGITYAEYARNGFWQILFVSIINFLAVSGCLYFFKENKVLKMLLTLLCGCTFIMIISAIYRLLIYVHAYDLTFLRILALWLLIVLAVIMAGVTISVYKKKFPLFRYLMIVVMIFYIALSFSQPDHIIAEYNIAQMQKAKEMKYFDIEYLTMLWSDDAAPVLAKLKVEDYSGDKDNIEDLLKEYFQGVEQEESNLNLRNFNLGRYKAKKAANLRLYK